MQWILFSTTSVDSIMETSPRILNNFMFNSAEHEFFLLINVKMPTVVGISTFMSKKKAFRAYPSQEKLDFLLVFYTYEHLKNHTHS